MQIKEAALRVRREQDGYNNRNSVGSPEKHPLLLLTAGTRTLADEPVRGQIRLLGFQLTWRNELSKSSLMDKQLG